MTTDIVDFWLIRVDLPAPLLGRLAAALDDTERERAAALALDEQRRRFIAAHGAARVILGHRLGVPPGQIHWRHGPHGKPELAPPDVQVSLSHSGEFAALAITSGRRVGVDVQQYPGSIDAIRVAARFYPPAEAQFVAAAGPARRASRFAALWVRKEACVKVTGGRLLQGLGLAVRGPGRIVVRDPGGPLPGPYLVRDVPVPPGFRAAVALDGAHPARLARHVWPASVVR